MENFYRPVDRDGGRNRLPQEYLRDHNRLYVLLVSLDHSIACVALGKAQLDRQRNRH